MRQLDFSNTDLWQGIILFGLNTATYKMALANALLDFSEQGANSVSWDELSQAFLQQYLTRLSDNDMPQQGTPSRLTVLERIIKELEVSAISYDEAVRRVATDGLKNVIPRFQTIARHKDMVEGHFYEFDFGKRLILKDTLLSFDDEERDELRSELIARWGLLEGAFSMGMNNSELSNDLRLIYLKSGYQRTSLTGNIEFLKGYQCNVCFYCGEPMKTDIHVDHVLPRQVINHDEIWNLALAHGDCNTMKSDRLVGPHFIEKLIARNENIMGSNHPWRHKIASQLGNTAPNRSSSLQKHYDNCKTILGKNWWGGSPDYNPEADPFYRRLITAINNR